MTKIERDEALARCDLEILRIADYRQSYAWLNALGEADWYAEKYLIEKEHQQTMSKAVAAASDFEKVSFETTKDLAACTVAALRTEPDYALPCARLKDPNTVRLLHAAMGMVTESAELLDMLKKHIFYGKPIDKTNALEELGDASWYQRIGLESINADIAEMLLVNIRKLRARFPERFTENAALNRDLYTERTVLEGGNTNCDELTCDGCLNCQKHCTCGPNSSPSPCGLKPNMGCRKMHRFPHQHQS